MDKKNVLLQPTPEVVAEVVALLNEINTLEEQNPADRKPLCELYDRYFALKNTYDLSDQIFEENGKKGLKNITGTILLPAIYNDIKACFNYSPAPHVAIPVSNESGKYALVQSDGKGTPITPFIYDDIDLLDYSNFYLAKKDQKYAVFTCRGKEFVPCIIDYFIEYCNDIYAFHSDGKEGLFTSRGLYVPPIFDQVGGDDWVFVKKGNQSGYIDTEGNFIDKDDEATDTAELLAWTDDD